MNKSVLMWLNYLAACLINTLGGSESSQYAAQNQSNNRPTENKPIFFLSPITRQIKAAFQQVSMCMCDDEKTLQCWGLQSWSHTHCAVHYNTFP